MASRRGGTPILSTNAPSIETANQSQINDLIQRNRTLEHTTKKLSAQLAEEVNRSKASVKEIQDKHEANQRQWKESCEDVLASYRIVQKQLEVELEKERYATLAEMGVAREEKLKRVQRDYKLKLFQMHEEGLERKLEEAEEEKYDLQVQQEVIMRKWMDHCTKYVTRLKDAQEGLERSENEKQDKAMKLNQIRESHANLDAEKETFTAKLKRANLNLGHEEDKNKELTKELDDAKRRIKDLSRQVDEWQKLEHSEGAEVESQRKKRMALEQQMQELTENHERELERLQRSLEKERERGEKIKEDRDRLEEEVNTNKKEVDMANNLVKKMEKRVEKLKDELEVERARVRPASPEKSHVSSAANDPGSDEVEVEELPTKIRTAVKPGSKRSATVKAGLSNKFMDTEAEAPKRQVARRTGGLPPRKPVLSKPDSDTEEILDNDKEDGMEEIERRRKRKGKAKASELDEDEPPVENKRTVTKKRKATPDNEDQESVEIIELPKAKRGTRAASQGRHVAPAGVSRGRSKPPNSRAASRQRSVKPVAEDEAENGGNEEGQPGPKKKRKININLFNTNEKGPASVLTSFGANELDIPTFLSPLKQDEPIPRRSVSLVGSLSNLMRLPFQR